MSEQAFGVLSLLYSFIPIVTTLGSLGLDHTLRRFQPEYLRAGRADLAAWLLQRVCAARLGSNLLLIAVVLLAWRWLAPLFKLEEYRPDFMIFSLLILLYFQVLILQYSFSSHMQHQYSVGSIAVLSGGKLLAYLALAFLDELTLRNAIFADTFAQGAAYAFLVLARARNSQAGERVVPAAPEDSDMTRMKRYAGFSHLNDSASLLTYTESDRFFIAALLNPVAVGAYAFYTRLSEMASTFVPLRLFENLVQPMFFGVPRNESDEKIPRYFTLLVNLNLLYQLPLIAMAVTYHREIVLLVAGGKFVEQSALLPLVIAFATTGNVLSVPVTMVAQYNERAPLILISQSFGIYQVLAMLILIPAIGLPGAAIATGTFHLFRNLFVWWHVRKVAVWTNFRLVVVYGAVIWLAAGWLCSLVRDTTTLPPAVDIFFGMIVCTLAVLVYIRSPAISESDRRILGNLLHGQEGKVLRWVGLVAADPNPRAL